MAARLGVRRTQGDHGLRRRGSARLRARDARDALQRAVAQLRRPATRRQLVELEAPYVAWDIGADRANALLRDSGHGPVEAVEPPPVYTTTVGLVQPGQPTMPVQGTAVRLYHGADFIGTLFLYGSIPARAAARVRHARQRGDVRAHGRAGRAGPPHSRRPVRRPAGVRVAVAPPAERRLLRAGPGADDGDGPRRHPAQRDRRQARGRRRHRVLPGRPVPESRRRPRQPRSRRARGPRAGLPGRRRPGRADRPVRLAPTARSTSACTGAARSTWARS